LLTLTHHQLLCLSHSSHFILYALFFSYFLTQGPTIVSAKSNITMQTLILGRSFHFHLVVCPTTIVGGGPTPPLDFVVVTGALKSLLESTNGLVNRST
jgi:hypothetical protein